MGEERDIDVFEELRLAGLKKETLHRSFDNLHAQANSILLFTLQWKDLEQHLDLTMKSLHKQTHEVDTAKKELERRAREIEIKETELGLIERKIEECNGVFEGKEKQLGLLQGILEECNGELEGKEKKLGLLQEKIEKCNGDLEGKEKKLDLVQRKIEECNCVLEDKEKQLGLVQKKIEECNGEIESKEKELGLVQKRVEEGNGEIESKEKQLGLVQKKIEECKGEIKGKEKQLGLVQKKIEKCNYDIESKEKKLGLVQKKIEECNDEIESQEKQLHLVRKRVEEFSCELQTKERELNLVRKSFADRPEKFNLKRESVDLVQEEIEKCGGELQQLESQRSLIKYCSEQLELKYKELNVVQSSIEEYEKDRVLKENHIASLQVLIGDYTEELEAKEKLYDAVKKSTKDCGKEFKYKDKELELTKAFVEAHLAELHSEEKKLEKQARVRQKELETKEKELNSVKKKVNQYYKDLELKEREFNGIRMCIEERNQELTMKEEQLRFFQKSIEECSKGFEVKEQLISIEKSIVKSSEELEVKQKQLHVMQNSVKELFEERESEELQLDLIKGMKSVCLEELKEKEKQFDSVKKCLEEGLQDLQMKEREFEDRVKEFELKERHFDSVRRAVEDDNKRVELKEKQLNDILPSHGKPDLAANEAIGPIYPSFPLGIVRNGRDLQCLLNEHSKKHDLICSEISTTLKTAHNPARLVLDAMQGFYPPCSKDGDMGFDVSIIRKSCILILEQLLIVSPQINPQVKEEAVKLAGEWKAKMRVAAENSLEVLGFLELLAAFGLASAFDGNELQCLFDVVAQHRQTPKLRQVLGVADKVLVTQIVPSQVKTEQTVHPLVNNALDSFSASLQHSTMTEGANLELFLNGLSDEPDLRQDEVSAALHMSPDPAKFVLDLIQGSYSTHQKKQGMGCEGVLRNYILLLEQLKKVLPQISPQVKSEAVKLAVEWKTKMESVNENSLEVFCFLQLLATYELVTYFNKEESLKLLKTIVQHKQAPEICRALGFTDMVPGFVWNLIEEKQYIEAIRFICAFKLMDKAPPEAILKEYLENVDRTVSDICKDGKNSPDAKDKAIDFKLTSLKALIGCIEDCRLEYLLLYEKTKKCILQLEKQKADRRCSVPVPRPMIKPLTQGKRNENVGAYASTNRPASAIKLEPQLGGRGHSIGASTRRDQLVVQNHYKRPRIDPPIGRDYRSQQYPAPINMSMSSSTGQYWRGVPTDGRHTQFNIGSSNHLRVTASMGPAEQLNVSGRQYHYHL